MGRRPQNIHVENSRTYQYVWRWVSWRRYCIWSRRAGWRCPWTTPIHCRCSVVVASLQHVAPPRSSTSATRRYSLYTQHFYASATTDCFLPVCPSVRPFVTKLNGRHDISKTDKMILLRISTSGLRGKGMKRSTLGVVRTKVKGQGHRRPKLRLEAWRRHHSRPRCVE